MLLSFERLSIKLVLILIFFMKKLVLSTLLVLQAVFVFAQQNPALKGKVVDAKSQKPLQNVVATIQSNNQSVLTDFEGNFVFQALPSGAQVLVIKSTGYNQQNLMLEPFTGETIDLGTIVLEEDITSTQRRVEVVQSRATTKI